MPLPIQLRRYSAELLKHFGLQGNVALTLVEDVAPNVDLWTLDRAELALLREEKLMGQTVEVAPVAAQFSFVGLYVPQGMGALVVVDEVVCINRGAAAMDIALSITGQALAAATQAARRDSRMGDVSGASSLAVSGNVTSGTSAVASTAARRFITRRAAIGAEVVIPCQAVIAPGGQLDCWGLTVNQGINVSFRWREFVAAPQEGQVVG